MNITCEQLLIGGLEPITIYLNGKMVLERLSLTINDSTVVLQHVYMVLNMANNEIHPAADWLM